MAGDKSLKKINEEFRLAKEIPGFPGYAVTLSGKIFSIKLLKPRVHSDGYLRFQCYGFSNKKSNRKRLGVHQAIALTFLPRNSKSYKEVRHLDGNKKNNSLSNLAWGSRKMNAQDMAKHGTVRGENNGNSLLTKEKVIEIRRLHASGNSYKKMSKEFGVSVHSIHAIVSKRNWNHI